MHSNIERDPPRRGPVEVWREVEISDASAVALRVAARMREGCAGQPFTGATVGGLAGVVQTIVDDAMPPGTFMLVKGKLAEVGPTEVVVDGERRTILARMRLRPLDDESDVVVLRAEI